MNSNPSSPGATPQPGGNDPNATRYFQPGEGNVPPPAETSRPETPRQETPTQAAYDYPYPNNPAPPQASAPPPPYASMPNVQPGHPFHPSADRHDRDRTALGFILIAGGVLFLLSQLASFGSFGNLVPLLIGGGFLYAYFSTKPGYRVGFLIPGAILTGIGVGELLEHFAPFRLGGDISALTLGIGFCAIWFFERKHWWALIPGGILVLSGLSTMYVIGSLWPLALIAIGVYLLYGQSRRKV